MHAFRDASLFASQEILQDCSCFPIFFRPAGTGTVVLIEILSNMIGYLAMVYVFQIELIIKLLFLFSLELNPLSAGHFFSKFF